jgi:tRNA pseudouridine55 synthase
VTSAAGILLVDKPAGPTSHDVVDRVRRAAGVRRVGHTGTLDPFATGLLILTLGHATRLSQYFLGMAKGYQATLRLGTETDSSDVDGEVTREDPHWDRISREDVEEGLAGLRGTILQTPPALSAKKLRGEASHRRVRRGEDVILSPVEVTVMELRLTGFEPPQIQLEVFCSSGTYVRALARDLGRSLGVGAHLTALRRTRIGAFAVTEAVALSELEGPETVRRALIPPARALSHMPFVVVGPEDAARIRHGQAVSMMGHALPEGELVRVLLEGELVAVATPKGDQLQPRKVMAHG